MSYFKTSPCLNVFSVFSWSCSCNGWMGKEDTCIMQHLMDGDFTATMSLVGFTLCYVTPFIHTFYLFSSLMFLMPKSTPKRYKLKNLNFIRLYNLMLVLLDIWMGKMANVDWRRDEWDMLIHTFLFVKKSVFNKIE
jgi:hypothetical protein